MRRTESVFLSATILLASIVGCATTEATAPDVAPAVATVATVPDLDLRALLLLLVDRQSFEPYTVDRALAGSPLVRADLAIACARIPDARCVPVLVGLLTDDDPSVRRVAAFGLGQHPEAGEVGDAVVRALRDSDSEVGRLAVDAAARLGLPLSQVSSALESSSRDEVRRRLLPSLFRFDEPGVVPIAAANLGPDEAELHRFAAYALARNPRPEGAVWLRSLLHDPDPWVRGWAARGLGRVGDGTDLVRLRPLLADDDSGPVIQALRAGAQIVRRGDAAAPEDWRASVLARLDDPSAQSRLAALEVAGVWLLDSELGTRLVELAREGEPRERELALRALAEGGDERTSDLAVVMARSADPVLRAAAVRVAAGLGLRTVVEAGGLDASAAVRAAALSGLLESEDGEAAARVALDDPDPVVRATALGWLAQHPAVPLVDLLVSIETAFGDRIPDARLASVAAVGARAGADAEEYRDAVLTLLDLADHPEYVLRREAIRHLEALGENAPELGTARPFRPVAVYREVLLRVAAPFFVEMETTRGSIVFELDCPVAPLTCLNFAQLADQGFYDGLALHRVIPDFVVQGGDPRGDGAGGPGFQLRDEFNPTPFAAGVLGMARSDFDTGGSQFFVALSDQPHLDGNYTAFGRVVEGMDVTVQIVQYDQVVRMRSRAVR